MSRLECMSRRIELPLCGRQIHWSDVSIGSASADHVNDLVSDQLPLTARGGEADSHWRRFGHFCSLATDSFRASHSARRLHAHGLIAKTPRLRSWRAIACVKQAMGTSPHLRAQHFHTTYPNAAQARSSSRKTKNARRKNLCSRLSPPPQRRCTLCATLPRPGWRHSDRRWEPRMHLRPTSACSNPRRGFASSG